MIPTTVHPVSCLSSPILNTGSSLYTSYTA